MFVSVSRRGQSDQPRRSGAVLVEFALVASIFGIFLAAVVEFSHVYMVINILNASTKRAARYGAVEGITSQQVIDRVNNLLGTTIAPAQATTRVMDGNAFDDPNFQYYVFNPNDPNLDIELADRERRELFIVRTTVPYEQVAIMPPFWIKNVTLVGQSVMRHE